MLLEEDFKSIPWAPDGAVYFRIGVSDTGVSDGHSTQQSNLQMNSTRRLELSDSTKIFTQTAVRTYSQPQNSSEKSRTFLRPVSNREHLNGMH
jgi:hypothetical protein